MRAPGRPDRLDRTILSLLGILLLAFAVYGLARGFGAFGDDRASDPFLTEWLRTWVRDHQLARIPAARTVSNVQLEDGEGGATVLAASALCDAIERDLEAGPAIEDARARVLDGPPHLRLDLRVKVPEDAAAADVEHAIERSLLEQLPNALPSDRLDARVEVRLTESAGRRVR
jgi:hypothetical protein